MKVGKAFTALLLVSALHGAAVPLHAEAGSKTRPSDRSPATPTSPSGEFILRVMTYNILGTPIPGLNQSSRYVLMAEALRGLRESEAPPHVIAIQEAFLSGTRALYEQSGFPHFIKGPTGKGANLGSGLLVLSEFPLAAPQTVVFEDCANWDCYSRKGALHTHIQIPGFSSPISIYNTHLQADNDAFSWAPPRAPYYARMTQVRQILGLMESATNSQTTGIMLGDFNFVVRSDEHAYLTQYGGLRNAAVLCSQRGSCNGHQDAATHLRDKIDHHLIQRSPQSSVSIEPIHYETFLTEPYQGVELSDHPAVMMHYRVKW